LMNIILYTPRFQWGTAACVDCILITYVCIIRTVAVDLGWIVCRNITASV